MWHHVEKPVVVLEIGKWDMRLLTYPIYCLKSFLQGLQLRRHLFFFCLLLSKEKEAPPGWLCPQSPRWGHTDASPATHKHSVNIFSPDQHLLGQCIKITSTASIMNVPPSPCHRMQIWPACWVQDLLGIWRTWAWPSPTSPVPVPSSSSSCRRSNSSTSGPHR